MNTRQCAGHFSNAESAIISSRFFTNTGFHFDTRAATVTDATILSFVPSQDPIKSILERATRAGL